jgi:hypothetical protein
VRSTDADIEAMVHHWRYAGYLMGAETTSSSGIPQQELRRRRNEFRPVDKLSREWRPTLGEPDTR